MVKKRTNCCTAKRALSLKKEEIAVQLRESYGKKRINCCTAKRALW
jgi:hypothetical protein